MKIEQIRKNLETGEFEKAHKQIKDMQQSENENDIFMLAEELMHLGFLDEAKGLFWELHKRFPKEGIILINLAEILIEQGDEEEAVLLLEKIDKQDETFVTSLLLLADCYETFDMPEVSEAKLILANEMIPEEPIIQFALGEIFFLHGNYADALSQYQKIKTPEIDGIAVVGRIAEVLTAVGRFEDSLDYYKQAGRSNHEDNFLFQYGIAAYHANELEIAHRKFTEVITQDSDYAAAHFYLAKIAEQTNELETAMEHLKKAIAIDNTKKENFHLQATLFLKIGQVEEAVEALQTAIALDPNYLEATIVLAKLHVQLEDFEAALHLIEVAKAENDDDPQFNWILASVHAGQENYHVAKKHFREAYPFYTENIEFLEEFGQFMLEEGELAEARQAFAILIEKDPTNETYTDILERL